MIYRRADDYDNAMAHLSKGLELARENDDKHGVADALYHMGSVAWSQGENLQATEYHREAYDIIRELNLTDIVAVQAIHGWAEAIWVSGYPEQAYILFEESLGLARQIGDKSYEAENLQMMAFMCTGTIGVADFTRSLDLAEQSLAISQSAHMD